MASWRLIWHRLKQLWPWHKPQRRNSYTRTFAQLNATGLAKPIELPVIDEAVFKARFSDWQCETLPANFPLPEPANCLFALDCSKIAAEQQRLVNPLKYSALLPYLSFQIPVELYYTGTEILYRGIGEDFLLAETRVNELNVIDRAVIRAIMQALA